MLARFFKSQIQKEVKRQVALTVTENDNTFYPQDQTANRDRVEASRIDNINNALLAWRVNPIARRLIELTNEFVLGADGIQWSCNHKRTAKFIDEFWNHRLNQINIQASDWLDELSRSGDLLFLCTVDDTGMVFVRALPAEQIKDIQTRPNDCRQELSYIPFDTETTPYPAYDPISTEQKLFVLHYAINRPIGCLWGESDLGHILKWIGHYSAWLENRATLNRFRNAFMFIIKGKFKNDQDKKKRQAELNTNPPQPGSVLVTDESETWDVISPKLEANDASNDGLALKKHIASGAGIPMHFLAEPEGSTRTTAESAGTPTFRRFEQRQKFFLWMLNDLLETVITVRKRVDPLVNPKATIDLRGNDISERDNTSLALAVTYIEQAFGDLYDRHLINEQEFMRIVYRFGGEVLDSDQTIPQGIRKDINKPAPAGTTKSGVPLPKDTKPNINKDTGEVTPPGENQ